MKMILTTFFLSIYGIIWGIAIAMSLNDYYTWLGEQLANLP